MDAQLLHYLDLLAEGRANEADPALRHELNRRYPYFSTPEANLAGSIDTEGLTSEEIKALKASIVMRSGNPDTVSSALGIKSDADFYGESQPVREKMTTESTIDSFLERYGNSADNDKEVALLEKLIFNPVSPDYTASLESLSPAVTPSESLPTESDTSSRHDRLIDAFIAKNSDEVSQSVLPLPEDTSDTVASPQSVTVSQPASHCDSGSESRQHALLTESLAKIYIKKGRYAKAFEIIHSLSLNYPEKSCYFADQLRFLHKLMLIQELQQKDKK